MPDSLAAIPYSYGMELWTERALPLMALKPHQRLYFQPGL